MPESFTPLLERVIEKYSKKFETSDIIRTGDLSVVVPGDWMASASSYIGSSESDSEDGSSSEVEPFEKDTDQYMDQLLLNLVSSVLQKTPDDVLDRIFPSIDSHSDFSFAADEFHKAEQVPRILKMDRSSSRNRKSSSHVYSSRTTLSLEDALHDFEKSVNVWERRTSSSHITPKQSRNSRTYKLAQNFRACRTSSPPGFSVQAVQAYYNSETTAAPNPWPTQEGSLINHALKNLSQSVMRWEHRIVRDTKTSYYPQHAIHSSGHGECKRRRSERKSVIPICSHILALSSPAKDYRPKNQYNDHSEKQRVCSTDDSYQSDISEDRMLNSRERVLRWLRYQENFES